MGKLSLKDRLAVVTRERDNLFENNQELKLKLERSQNHVRRLLAAISIAKHAMEMLE
jgi:hypothetical protein